MAIMRIERDELDFGARENQRGSLSIRYRAAWFKGVAEAAHRMDQLRRGGVLFDLLAQVL
jgi:hypothetical protein